MASNSETLDSDGINTEPNSSLSHEEKLEQARVYKQQGNESYKSKCYKKAISKYHRALLFLKGIESSGSGRALLQGLSPQAGISVPEHVQTQMLGLKLDCFNNLAACILQQEEPNYHKVTQYCDSVLEIDGSNVKAMYRKSVALCKLQQYDEAHVILQKAVRHPAGAKDGNIKRQLQLCETEQRKQDQKMKSTYKNMFEKLASQPDLETG